MVLPGKRPDLHFSVMSSRASEIYSLWYSCARQELPYNHRSGLVGWMGLTAFAWIFKMQPTLHSERNIQYWSMMIFHAFTALILGIRAVIVAFTYYLCRQCWSENWVAASSEALVCHPLTRIVVFQKSFQHYLDWAQSKWINRQKVESVQWYLFIPTQNK